MPYDILLLTYNRLPFLKQTINGLYERIKTPFRLVVVDNNSSDGTREWIEQDERIYSKVLLDKPESICRAYTIGLEYIESDLFFMMQDDIIVPKLEPDCFAQLIALMEKYPDHGGIACRVQKIPSVTWTDGDISPARKALSAYCRIQRKSDLIKVDGLGDRYWDDLEFVKRIRDKLGKKCSWANNIWCNHLGYMVANKGYGKNKRLWGWSESRMTEYLRKPYPQINPETNEPM